MSTLEATLRPTCPSCGVVLIADELPSGGKALCANCGHRFQFQPLGDTRRTSRKAVASLALGIASLLGFCLTALPGVLLGAWALADIHRDEERLRGRKMAITGMVLSVVFGFLALVVWAVLLPAIQMLMAQ
jgi:uncharacterized paraquat-inducible protein A